MKSLLDIQQDIRELEKSVSEISDSIKQINNDIDDLRNQERTISADYEEIDRMAKLLPFKRHPIKNVQNEKVVVLYLELLLNLVQLDKNMDDNAIDNRLIYIQWLLNSSKLEIPLERLLINSHKMKSSAFGEFAELVSNKYKESFIVDLLVIANINGDFNGEECEYVATLISILRVDEKKLKVLALIAKLVLTQKRFDIGSDVADDLIEELSNYKFCVGNIFRDILKKRRNIVVEIHSDDAYDFKWKAKQQERVQNGTVIATYKVPKKKRGYSFIAEYIDKEIISPEGGVLFQFRDNNVIYGVLAHETDNKDSIKSWIKSERK